MSRMARCPGWQDVPDGKMSRMARCPGWQDVPDGKMSRIASPIKEAKHAFRMASPERAIYRAGSLTLPFGPVSACHVSNPERVIQHEALWPEVPSDTIDASLQPTAFIHAPPTCAPSTCLPFTYVSYLWRGVTLHGNNPFRV